MVRSDNEVKDDVLKRYDMGIRAVKQLAEHLKHGVESHEDRITILCAMAIQSVYCIAIEMEEADVFDKDNSAAGALKVVLDAFVVVEPNVVSVEPAPTSNHKGKESIH